MSGSLIPKSFVIRQGDYEFTISNIKYKNTDLYEYSQKQYLSSQCPQNHDLRTDEQGIEDSREMYLKLMELVDRYGVKLSKNFTIDDEFDEMKEEYDMHIEYRNKNNQVKFYKNLLLNIICGTEFLNEKYDQCGFKLKDWSKQIASDMDDYTEVLGELYEKYKNKGGKMTPELRAVFMLIMSGITYHLSQKLFGSTSLNETIKNNPSILNKLIGGIMANTPNTNEINSA